MEHLLRKLKLFFLLIIALQSILWAKPVSLISDNGNSIKLKFTLPGYSLEKVKVAGKFYTQIKSEGSAVNLEKGAPELPFFTQSVAIPNSGAVKITVDAVHSEEISVGKIISSKGSIPRSINPASVPYTFGEVYLMDELINKNLASLSNPYIFRDIRGAAVTFSPFAYNPVKGILKIAKEIEVTISSTTGRSVNELKRNDFTVSKAFKEVYEGHFINYASNNSRYTTVYDGEKMIVICASKYKTEMQDFVEWKNQKGIETVLYEYPSETGGSGSSSLKNFIQNKYQNDDITYVLLVGDAADIPSPNASGGLSDPTYTKVSGSDHYPDIFVGRFSVNSTTYASNMVDKALHYEKEPLLGGSWYTKAVGHASNEGSPPDYEWMNDMRDVMLAATYTEMDKIYQGMSGSISVIQSALSEGRGWYNYMGHGYQQGFGFSGSNVGNNTFNSTADYKNPVVISVACNNGEFDYGADCIGEYATKISKKGAIAFLGSYISQPWTPPQYGQKEMVRLLTNDDHISIGAIVYNGGSKMLDVGSSGGSYLETFDTWTLFGDPSIMVFNDVPSELSVSDIPSSIGTGSQTVNVDFGETIDGRVCVYSADNGILASEIVEGKSSSSLNVKITDESAVILTVTARNKKPYIETIPVQTGPSISVKTPNGGEKINTGTSYTITWSDNIDADVKIELYKGGSSVATLADAAESNGSFKWDVDASLENGTDYKVKISGDGVDDMSDADFTIGEDVADKYTLTVDGGSGDGDYTEGSTVEIEADDPSDGEIFDKWIGDVDNIDDINSAIAKIIMPGKNITVEATYKVKPSDNIIFIATWEANFDNSTVDLDTTKIFTDTLLTADFDIGKSEPSNNMWPWGNITGYFGFDFEGVTEIELTYKSDKPILVVLDQEGLSDNGDSYNTEIPATNGSWKTVKLKVNTAVFKQPEWKTTTADLDLSKVSSISFQPDVDGETAAFELESGFLYGAKGGTVSTVVMGVNKKLAGINLVNSAKIGFTVKDAGIYNVKIFSLDGRVLFTSTNSFSSGSHIVHWKGSEISKGIYLITLEGMNKNFVKKAVLR